MTNEKSTAKTKDEMRWAMVRPELEAAWRGAFGALRMGAARGGA